MRRVLLALIALVLAAAPTVVASSLQAVRADQLQPGPTPIGQLTIGGTTQLGYTLSAGSAIWPVAGASTYAWSIVGTDMTGAGQTYLLTQEAVGHQVMVTETFSAAGYENATATATSATIIPGAAPPQPAAPSTIKGIVRVGEVLDLVPARWPALGRTTVAWTAGGVVVGTGKAYVVTPDTLGKQLTVTETWTGPGYADGAASSASATVGSGQAPTPSIRPRVTGTVRVGSALTAFPGVWPVRGASTFIWSADGETVGTGRSYVVRPADSGKQIILTEQLSSAGYETGNANVRLGLVPKEPIRMTVAIGKAKHGKRVSLTVKVRSGRSVVPGRVTATYTGKVRSRALKGGTITVRLPARPKGRYWLTVSYAGPTMLAKASRTLSVKVR